MSSTLPLVGLLSEYQSGNKEAGKEIVGASQVQNLINREVRKWNNYEADEVRHIAHIIVLQILSKLHIPDDSQGGHIISYLNKVLPLRMITALKNLNEVDTEFEVVSMDAVITDNSGGEMTLHDVIPSNQSSIEDMYMLKERREEVRAAIRNLTPKEQRVIYLYYYEQRNQQYIADEFGVSQQAIDKALGKALSKLKECL